MMTRRQVLGTVAVLLVGGGGASLALLRPLDDPAQPVIPRPPQALMDAITRTQSAVATYDTTALQAPALAGRLAIISADHRTHLATLLAELARYPAPNNTRPPTSVPSSAAPINDPAAALALLRDLENAAAVANTQACLAGSGALAVVYGCMSACNQAHLELLA